MSAAGVTTKRERGLFAGPQGRYRKTTLLAYVFLLPSVLILVIFHFIGMAYGLFISLHRWGLIAEEFLWFENYGRALASDSALWQALTVTFYYALCVIPIQLPLALVIAYLLFQPIKGRDAFRVLYFLPYITSTVAGAAVWEWILDPYNGVLNFALERIGINALDTIMWLNEPKGLVEILLNVRIADNPVLLEAVPGGWGNFVGYILAGPSLALIGVTLASAWHYLGFDIVIFLAGLGGIPSELYEAAHIDGANEWQAFRHITIPLLSPTTFFLLITTTIGVLQTFNTIYIMTNGNPLGRTRTVTMLVFQNFFDYTRLGYGSSLAFILFFIILGITILQFRLGGRRVHY